MRKSLDKEILGQGSSNLDNNLDAKEEAIKKSLRAQADKISGLVQKGDIAGLKALLNEIHPAQQEEDSGQEIRDVDAIPKELKVVLDKIETWDELLYFARKGALDTLSNIFKHLNIGKEVIGQAYQKIGDEKSDAVWRLLNMTIRQLKLNKDNLDGTKVFSLLAQVVILWDRVRNSAELQKESEGRLISDLSFQFMPLSDEKLQDISLDDQRTFFEEFLQWAKGFGMNKADVAHELSVNQAYVSWYSGGARRMSKEFLEKMADLLTSYKLGGVSFAGLENFIGTYFERSTK